MILKIILLFYQIVTNNDNFNCKIIINFFKYLVFYTYIYTNKISYVRHKFNLPNLALNIVQYR